MSELSRQSTPASGSARGWSVRPVWIPSTTTYRHEWSAWCDGQQRHGVEDTSEAAHKAAQAASAELADIARRRDYNATRPSDNPANRSDRDE